MVLKWVMMFAIMKFKPKCWMSNLKLLKKVELEFILLLKLFKRLKWMFIFIKGMIGLKQLFIKLNWIFPLIKLILNIKYNMIKGWFWLLILMNLFKQSLNLNIIWLFWILKFCRLWLRFKKKKKNYNIMNIMNNMLNILNII